MNKHFRAAIWVALMALPLAAEASFHVMSIREVYAGSPDNPGSQYVMLQMRSNGQNQLSGHRIRTYNSAGTVTGTYTFSASVASGVSQRFVLIATPAAVTQFGVAADLTMAATLDPVGGRVCFDDIDCFAWGTYSGSATLPGTTMATQAQCQTGTPFMAADGLAPGRAARRDISAGNASLLETADDTGSSSNDFDFSAVPIPTNNAGVAATPPAVGSGFNFADFNDISALNLNGSAATATGVLRVTPVETAPNAGSMFSQLHQPVSSGFNSVFGFRVTQVGATGADGFAFVLHNESSSSLGDSGAGIGYAGITNSFAVEFDTHYNTAAEIGTADPYEGIPGNSNDPAENHLSVHTAGAAVNSASEAASIGVSAALPALADGAVHMGRVEYVPGNLQVYVDDLDVPVLRASVNLSTLLQLYSGAAFVGFTAAAPVDSEDHDLLSWQFGTAAVDTTPSAFAFVDQASVMPNTVVTSASIAVGGINSPVAISVVDGEYSITPLNGVAGAFSSSNGMISAGDRIVVRHTSGASAGTMVSTTLTIGGVSDAFTSTVGSFDTTPTAFTFPNVSNAQSGQVRTSATRIISSINTPVPATISGDMSAQLLVNGSVVPSGISVTDGSQVALRVTAPAAGGATATVMLTVGTYSTSWNVTTAVDSTPTAITFANVSNALSGQVRTSQTKTVSGINAPVAATISGDPTAQLLVNGSVVPSGTAVSAGNQIALRVTAPAAGGATATVMLTVGTYSTSWIVTTVVDTSPTAFSFPNVTNATAGQLRNSAIRTISGINAPASVSLSGSPGAQVLINGALASLPTTVNAGDTVRLRVTAPASGNTGSVSLTVGTYSTTWMVSTP